MMRHDQILFGDLSLEVGELRAEIEAAVDRVLSRGWFVLGAEVEAFEQEFAQFVGARYAVGCANGTDAITLALRALGVKAGDEVITVANTCVPTAAGIRDAGCALRLIDCDAETLQMDALALERALTNRTRAVVPVHLYGSSPDMRAIARVCESAKVPIVEDCAQAHGAQAQGRTAGRWGILAAWSFYPSKNLGAYGDGGAITTDDAELAERLRRLRNYGQRARYYHDEEGRNSRLDELQAAILRVKLKYLSAWNARRRAIADLYESLLEGSVVRVPRITSECVSARHLFPVRVPSEFRDEIRRQLEAASISTQIHYPVPIHRQKAYAAMFPDLRLPQAEAAAAELVSLPLYPQLTDEQAQRVAFAIRAAAMRCNDAKTARKIIV
jgi:dTDP-4-amino-4,6-dideoxygalactose transaminase